MIGSGMPSSHKSIRPIVSFLCRVNCQQGGNGFGSSTPSDGMPVVR